MFSNTNNANRSPVQSMLTPVETPIGNNMVSKAKTVGDKEHSVWFWLGLFIVFITWGVVQHKSNKVSDELKPANLYANVHNLMLITFAAVIGVVGGKIFFTKLAAVTGRIPFVNQATAYLAQLFSAA